MKREDIIVDSVVDKLLSRLQVNVLQIKLNAFCNEYSEYVKRNRAKRTYEGAEQVCDKLLKYFSPEKSVETITLKDAENLLNKIKEKAPKGVYNYHRVLRAMFNKGVQWNYLRENVFEKVKLPRRQIVKPAYVTEEMLQEIVNKIELGVIRELVVTAFYTGCRLGELTKITWQDVNLKDKIITIGNEINETKTRKQRVVPIHPKVEEILMRRLRGTGRREGAASPEPPSAKAPAKAGQAVSPLIKGGSKQVFCKKNGCGITGDFVSKRFKKACREAGVDEGIHFHCLRHGAITSMIMKGAPLPVVQRIAGHAQIQTLMIYTHPDLESMREAVNRL